MIRTKTAAVAACVALAALVGACQKTATTAEAAKPGADTAAIEQALRANETQWNADYAAKDAAKLSAHYAPDAALMSPGAPIAIGSDAVKRDLTAMTSDPALSLSFAPDKVDVAASGDLAYTRGHFTMTATDPATKKVGTTTGSYITIYKKQADGSWKAVEDIVTPGAAAPAAAPKAG
jgi:uncharacterized protein (TIGR02246 family)